MSLIQMSRMFTTSLVLASCVFLVSSLKANGYQYDGTWKAVMTTDVGGCAFKYRFKFEVKKGNVYGSVNGNRGVYKLSGQIAKTGTTKLKLNGFDPSNLIGVFDKSAAKGTWESENCEGTFIFNKVS